MAERTMGGVIPRDTLRQLKEAEVRAAELQFAAETAYEDGRLEEAEALDAL